MPGANKTLNATRRCIVDMHWEALLNDGAVRCDSPYIRKMLYERLDQEQRRFTTTVVGETGRRTSLNPYSGGIGYDAKRAMKWLCGGRIYREDLLSACECYNGELYARLTLDDIEALYRRDVPHDAKYAIMQRIAEPPGKYGLLDDVRLHSLVKQITLQYPGVP